MRTVAIFLDVSGVMVPFSPLLSRKSSQDPYEGLLKLIQSILLHASVEVVLTTSLREAYSLEELKTRFFKDKEVLPYIKGMIGKGENKACAIDAYLKEHFFDAFLVFDDSKAEGLEKFQERFILVDGIRLLSPENMERGMQVVRKMLSLTNE